MGLQTIHFTFLPFAEAMSDQSSHQIHNSFASHNCDQAQAHCPKNRENRNKTSEKKSSINHLIDFYGHVIGIIIRPVTISPGLK
jgi:hypothetical protein